MEPLIQFCSVYTRTLRQLKPEFAAVPRQPIKELAQDGSGVKRAPQRTREFLTLSRATPPIGCELPCLGARIRRLCATSKSHHKRFDRPPCQPDRISCHRDPHGLQALFHRYSKPSDYH